MPSLGNLDSDGALDLFVGSLTDRPEIWSNETPSGKQQRGEAM